MTTPAIITAPTCRFKNKRKGLHIGIVHNNICGDCLRDMQASLTTIFTGGPVFCHECGAAPAQDELLSFLYRDTGAMILCEPCRIKFAPKIVHEVDATAADKEAIAIKSVIAEEQIAAATNPYKKLSLWEQWRRIVGYRRPRGKA